MKIQVIIKTVYGNDLVYPWCTVASTFCALLGTKTLTSRNITHIKDLGYKIELVAYEKVVGEL
jgi:hypothetical protein